MHRTFAVSEEVFFTRSCVQSILVRALTLLVENFAAFSRKRALTLHAFTPGPRKLLDSDRMVMEINLHMGFIT